MLYENLKIFVIFRLLYLLLQYKRSGYGKALHLLSIANVAEQHEVGIFSVPLPSDENAGRLFAEVEIEMAAYAAVTSLMGSIHLISQSSLDLQEGNKEHLESLYVKVGSLLEFLDNSDNDLQKKVKDLAHEAEDEVESQVLLVMEKDEHVRTEANKRLLKILRQAIEDVVSVKEELSKQRKNDNLQAVYHLHGGSSSPRLHVSTLENDLVGYNIEQQHTRDQLRGQSFYLEVICIAGMGSLGKSTFANKMFSDPSIDQGIDKEEIENAELADHLQKCLKGRRYLIVVDDIWSMEAWDEIRMWFPENKNKSRITLLTTRDMKGLSSKRTLDEWKEVAQGVSSLVNVDDYQRCSRVLALSYNYLPSNLKACFLYFGVFAKASEISVKKLIRLWIAEGLFELRGLGELQKVAANLLHDLIDKNLVSVSKQSLDGKVKTCKIHDLLHDLCLVESESENFLYVSNPSISEPKRDCQWVSVHSKRGCFSPFLSYNKTHSIHFSSEKLDSSLKLKLDHFKLLRVLDLGILRFTSLPSELSHFVSLRYFTVMVSVVVQYLPIYKLLNLQSFIFLQDYRQSYNGIQLSNGIWKMSQLRHLHCRSIYLNSPPKISANDVQYRVLENLQSISGLSPFCCTKEIFEGIKKVKQLGISN
ncbi:hypothetical protein RND71_032322 [Anisodus tanguticus]|uniref:NB-ARC domain-containing protein n=1 Tax=Anisodus tanguticus TaxID=243964 RepID=A0AAE1UZR2_9SOLA|nr:hypothetical protein RND71_032322 [Anisodus tanguticus]